MSIKIDLDKFQGVMKELNEKARILASNPKLNEMAEKLSSIAKSQEFAEASQKIEEASKSLKAWFDSIPEENKKHFFPELYKDQKNN